MKTAALLPFLMFPFLAFGTQVTCIENTGPAGQPPRKMILSQISGGTEPLQEEQRYPFQLEFFTGANREPISVPVVLTTIDVIVNFASEDGRVNGVVFKDEPDQSALNIDGENIGFDCNQN